MTSFRATTTYPHIRATRMLLHVGDCSTNLFNISSTDSATDGKLLLMAGVTPSSPSRLLDSQEQCFALLHSEAVKELSSFSPVEGRLFRLIPVRLALRDLVHRRASGGICTVSRP